MMAWITQGPVTDRTVEHLGRSDIGVTMLRRMFKEQMGAVARGEDPLGVIRDAHDRIDLPSSAEVERENQCQIEEPVTVALQ